MAGVENLSVGNLSKRRKKFERDEQRELLRKVETLLPPAWTSHATRNCAGRRSMGLAGRSELDVLLDLQRYLRHLRENSTRKCRSDEDEVAKQSAPRAVLGVARETLLDAGNMLVLELDMGLEMDVPRCRVCAAGRAAERILVFAPSESCLGRNLGQLVHAEDFVPFIAAWRRASSRAGQTPPAQQPATPVRIACSRELNFSVPRIPTISYVEFEVQLFPFETSGTPCALLVACLPPAALSLIRGELGVTENPAHGEHSSNPPAASSLRLRRAAKRTAAPQRHLCGRV
jgi:hypothetical protein